MKTTLTWFDPTPAGIQLCIYTDGSVANAGFCTWEDLPGTCADIQGEYPGITYEDTGLLSLAEHIEATSRPKRVCPVCKRSRCFSGK